MAGFLAIALSAIDPISATLTPVFTPQETLQKNQRSTRDFVSNLPTIKLFILAGQSNMVGYQQSNFNQLPYSLQQPQPQVLWADCQWSPLQPPTEPLSYRPGISNSQRFGPEVTLGAMISSHLDETIALVKYAKNGTNLERQWNPSFPGSFYHKMMDRVQQAIGELSRLGYQVEVAGFFWMQGESDAHNDSYMASNYYQNFTQFIYRLRQDLSAPQLPVIYGLIPLRNHQISVPVGIFEYGDVVRMAQFQVNQFIPHTRAVETLYFSRDLDNLHFNSFGLMSLGYYLAREWLQLDCDRNCYRIPAVDWAKNYRSFPMERLTVTGRQCFDAVNRDLSRPIVTFW